MTKLKTITLSHGHRLPGATSPHDPLGYRVERITDSTEFAPRDLISKAQVDELCENSHWKVTITPIER